MSLATGPGVPSSSDSKHAVRKASPVTQLLPTGNSSRPVWLLLLRIFWYAAAVALPWFGTVLSIQEPALRGTPLAITFGVIAGVTIFAGLGPGLLSAIAGTLTFNHCLLAEPAAWFSYAPASLFHSAIIFAVGLLIVILCERQRISSNRLRLALASLQVRTDLLIEAQQGSKSAAWMYNVEADHMQWAQGGAEVFGRPFSDISDAHLPTTLILHEDRFRVLRAIEDAAASGSIFQVEFRVRWPDGDVHWLESRGTPSPGNPKVWHGVTVDITDRKNAEFALVRSEKLAAIGRLSATVAHEVNNPLEAVTNLLFLALGEPDLPPAAREHLERADRELARLANIARRTLTFVRPRTSSGSMDPLEVIDSVVAMFQPRCAALGADIRVLHDSAVTLAVPADDFRQILTNIVSNACDALPDSGGVIEIEITRHDDCATICVRDNGSGIAPENLNRVFDPFFTTKEDVGTGIGLWVTKDLVEKNGGRIALLTQNLPAGFSTLFRIELPLMQKRQEPKSLAHRDLA